MLCVAVVFPYVGFVCKKGRLSKAVHMCQSEKEKILIFKEQCKGKCVLQIAL